MVDEINLYGRGFNGKSRLLNMRGRTTTGRTERRFFQETPRFVEISVCEVELVADGAAPPLLPSLCFPSLATTQVDPANAGASRLGRRREELGDVFGIVELEGPAVFRYPVRPEYCNLEHVVSKKSIRDPHGFGPFVENARSNGIAGPRARFDDWLRWE